MHPNKVKRSNLKNLTDLPNIGKAGASDLELLGVKNPQQLIGMCPFQMFERLCEKTAVRHDPCILDVFISVTHFMNGEAPRDWWKFTAERKQALAHRKAHTLNTDLRLATRRSITTDAPKRAARLER